MNVGKNILFFIIIYIAKNVIIPEESINENLVCTEQKRTNIIIVNKKSICFFDKFWRWKRIIKSVIKFATMGNNCGLDEDVKKIKTGIVKIIKITLYFKSKSIFIDLSLKLIITNTNNNSEKNWSTWDKWTLLNIKV